MRLHHSAAANSGWGILSAPRTHARKRTRHSHPHTLPRAICARPSLNTHAHTHTYTQHTHSHTLPLATCDTHARNHTHIILGNMCKHDVLCICTWYIHIYNIHIHKHMYTHTHTIPWATCASTLCCVYVYYIHI